LITIVKRFIVSIQDRGLSPICRTAAIHNLTQIDRSNIWQKGYRSGPLDCVGERSLMLGTTTGQSPGNDFAAFGNEISQGFRIFVIDYNTGIRAEPANFPAMVNSSFSPGFLVSSLGS
jgi:hypothetical protein